MSSFLENSSASQLLNNDNSLQSLSAVPLPGVQSELSAPLQQSANVSSSSIENTAEYNPGELIVKFKDQVTASAKTDSALNDCGIRNNVVPTPGPVT